MLIQGSTIKDLFAITDLSATPCCVVVGDIRVVGPTLPAGIAQCVVTSPPYWTHRDYGSASQLGQEASPQEYATSIAECAAAFRCSLKDDGTFWLNVGDTYAKKRLPGGIKAKDLVGIPWLVAQALRADGWFLRSSVVWHKPNPTPESVKNRPTQAYEHVFLLSKAAQYYYDYMAISEKAIYAEQHARKATSWGTHRKHPNKANVANYAFVGENHTTLPGGRKNSRNVWTMATKPYRGAHVAPFPVDLPTKCIKAATREGDLVFDPFCGAATTAIAALRLNRRFLGVELNRATAEEARERILRETGVAAIVLFGDGV